MVSEKFGYFECRKEVRKLIECPIGLLAIAMDEAGIDPVDHLNHRHIRTAEDIDKG